jgi:inner membrane transporter RhtA
MIARAQVTPSFDPLAGAGTAIAAITLFQIVTALSRPLMEAIGASSVTWLRMVAAAVFLIFWIRPRLVNLPRKAVGAALCLGAALGAMSLAAFSAVQLLPIGMVATIAFLGPLTLAVIGAGGARSIAMGFAALAGLGVVLILAPVGNNASEGWAMDPLGIALALVYAALWALYMVLTRRVGQLFPGRDGLCLSFVAAAVILAPFGVSDLAAVGPQPISLTAVLGSLTLGLLAPCLSAGMEMQALRRLSMQSFGILMSLEPAIATLLGMAFLHEAPNLVQVMGMICVSVASAAVVFLPNLASASSAEAQTQGPIQAQAQV